jgi:hypothetical protein
MSSRPITLCNLFNVIDVLISLARLLISCQAYGWRASGRDCLEPGDLPMTRFIDVPALALLLQRVGLPRFID